MGHSHIESAKRLYNQRLAPRSISSFAIRAFYVSHCSSQASAMTDPSQFGLFIFLWAFNNCATTIVSGSVTSRIKFSACTMVAALATRELLQVRARLLHNTVHQQRVMKSSLHCGRKDKARTQRGTSCNKHINIPAHRQAPSLLFDLVFVLLILRLLWPIHPTISLLLLLLVFEHLSNIVFHRRQHGVNVLRLPAQPLLLRSLTLAPAVAANTNVRHVASQHVSYLPPR